MQQLWKQKERFSVQHTLLSAYCHEPVAATGNTTWQELLREVFRSDKAMAPPDLAPYISTML